MPSPPEPHVVCTVHAHHHRPDGARLLRGRPRRFRLLARSSAAGGDEGSGGTAWPRRATRRAWTRARRPRTFLGFRPWRPSQSGPGPECLVLAAALVADKQGQRASSASRYAWCTGSPRRAGDVAWPAAIEVGCPVCGESEPFARRRSARRFGWDEMTNASVRLSEFSRRNWLAKGSGGTNESKGAAVVPRRRRVKGARRVPSVSGRSGPPATPSKLVRSVARGQNFTSPRRGTVQRILSRMSAARCPGESGPTGRRRRWCFAAAVVGGVGHVDRRLEHVSSRLVSSRRRDVQPPRNNKSAASKLISAQLSSAPPISSATFCLTPKTVRSIRMRHCKERAPLPFVVVPDTERPPDTEECVLVVCVCCPW
jgi:hypothetical protein